MLIIAVPKSASTALMETLARAHKIPCDMHYRWVGPRSEEFPMFHIQHQFGWELDEKTVSELTASGVLHKSHILPSTNNQRLLQKHKKVILLRQPEQIIGAYKRGEETGVYRQKTDQFSECGDVEEWVARAKKIGLFRDLQAFCDRWTGHDGDKLLVHFDELVSDPAGQIARIEDYFGFEHSGTAHLLKRKYTRLGELSYSYHKRTETSWKDVDQPEL